MTKLLLLIAGFLTISVSAQADLALWVGHWEGSCTVFPPLPGVRQIDGSLDVAPTAGKRDSYSWKLMFDFNGARPREVRDYTLSLVDEVQGHYVIDQNNGVLIDAYLTQDVLYAPFLVNSQLLNTRYEIGNDVISFEAPAFWAKPVRHTCYTASSQLCADSFALKQVQKCVLMRGKPPATRAPAR